MSPERRSDAGPLLAAWGVELEEDTVVGDLSIAPTVQMEKAGRVVHFDYPVWMSLRPDLMDPSDIVTGELGNVTFGTAGVLRAREGATTQFLSLIRTSDQAKRYPQSAVGALSDPEALLDGYAPEGEPLTLAARVSGPARSAFPDGAPPPSDDAQGEAADPSAHRNESDGDINLIVFADADLLADHFWVQVQSLLGTRFMVPTAANNSLVINALDNLTGSSDLIDVRNRGTLPASLRAHQRVAPRGGGPLSRRRRKSSSCGSRRPRNGCSRSRRRSRAKTPSSSPTRSRASSPAFAKNAWRSAGSSGTCAASCAAASSRWKDGSSSSTSA